MNVPTIAKAIVLNDKGELLLLRRSETDTRRPMQWDMPGGNVDEGEDIRAAVIRETAEEAGVTLHKPVVVYGHSEPRLPHGLPTWIFFAEKLTATPPVTLSDEHVEYVWMPIAQALQEIEYPLHQQVLRYLQDNKVLEYVTP